MIYRAIGKAVVTYGTRYVWRNYRRQLTLGAALAAVALGGAAWWASREVTEG